MAESSSNRVFSLVPSLEYLSPSYRLLNRQHMNHSGKWWSVFFFIFPFFLFYNCLVLFFQNHECILIWWYVHFYMVACDPGNPKKIRDGKNWEKIYTTWEQLQNTRPLIYMSLIKNNVYCVMPRSSKPPDTCKWGGPKWPGILKFSPSIQKTCFLFKNMVKFPHSPILHYAFSSWIEKTMTITIHCHRENRFVLQ